MTFILLLYPSVRPLLYSQVTEWMISFHQWWKAVVSGVNSVKPDSSASSIHRYNSFSAFLLSEREGDGSSL